jgi:hypothetical protein
MFSEHVRKTYSSTTVRQADVTKVFKGLNNDIDVEQELASLGHDIFSEFTTLSNGDQVPKLPAGFTIDIVDGLHVITNGFSCNNCYKYVGVSVSKRGHDREASHQVSSWSLANIQKSASNGYFGIHDPADRIRSADEQQWLAAKEYLDGLQKTALMIDPLLEDERFQNQFERSVRWSIEIKDKDPKALLSLCSAPNPRDLLFPLKEACNNILRDINDSLPTGDRILRDKLKPG